MNKSRIIISLITDKDKIIKMVIKDTVKKIGDSGYVSLPKQLINKHVKIELEVLK